MSRTVVDIFAVCSLAGLIGLEIYCIYLQKLHYNELKNTILIYDRMYMGGNRYISSSIPTPSPTSTSTLTPIWDEMESSLLLDEWERA